MSSGGGDDPLPAISSVRGAEKEAKSDSDTDLYDPGRGSPDHRSRTQWWAWPKKMYYRYKLSTGVYMLGPGEELILHFFFLLGVYFIVTYGLQFYSEMSKGGYLDESS